MSKTTIAFLSICLIVPCILTAEDIHINKLCSESDGRIKYTNQDIQSAGYKPCGQVAATKACSPTGSRFISSVSNPPHAYLDCGIGERITVVKNGVMVPYRPQNQVTNNDIKDQPDSFVVEHPKVAYKSGSSNILSTKVEDISAKYDNYLKTLNQLLDDE